MESRGQSHNPNHPPADDLFVQLWGQDVRLPPAHDLVPPVTEIGEELWPLFKRLPDVLLGLTQLVLTQEGLSAKLRKQTANFLATTHTMPCTKKFCSAQFTDTSEPGNKESPALMNVARQ